MNCFRKKINIVLFTIIVALVCVFVAVILLGDSNVYADELDSQTTDNQDFIVLDDDEGVDAIYEFVMLNDSECSVRLLNKSDATKAVIPSTGMINGKDYTVTEIAANGFMSASKLKKVSLPYTVKKIGSMAFSNCVNLERVSLANVEEIGNTAFFRCSSLTEIVIPKSVYKIGSYVFRNNNTKIRVRAESAGTYWNALWNSNNQNQDVEYNSIYIQPLELEPIYDSLPQARSIELVGYKLAGGQPRTDVFYSVSSDNSSEFFDGNNIYIPAQFEGVDIISIDEMAFCDAKFDRFVIEYSEKPILLGFSTFLGAEGDSLFINRSIEFVDNGGNELKGGYEFAGIDVDLLVLPNNIDVITNGMFAGAAINNIIFRESIDTSSRNEIATIIETLPRDGKVYLPQNEIFNRIGVSAFDSTIGIKELHIYSNVTNVESSILGGWNDETQIVYIHNNAPIPDYTPKTEGGLSYGWHPQWKSQFTNIIFDKEFYDITLNPTGGMLSGQSILNVVKGEKIGCLPVPEWEHHNFEGWYDENGNMISGDTIYCYNYNIELFARWSDVKYKVILDPQNGENTTEIEAIYGEKMPDAVQPVREGYKFKGYFSALNGNGTKYYDSAIGADGLMVSVHDYDDVTCNKLYAHWQEIVALITYELNGGTNSEDNPSTINYFDNITLLVPSRPGYIFEGWYLNGEKVNSLTHISEDEIVLEAHWDTRLNTAVVSISVGTKTVRLSGQSQFIIKLSTSINDGLCHLIIAPEVQKVHIFSERYTSYKLYITIEERSANIDLMLENLSITPDVLSILETYDITTAITMEGSTGTLNLFAYGKVSISGSTGGNGTANHKNGGDGGNAIYCPNLNIKYADNLTILGGDGGSACSPIVAPGGVPGNGGFAIIIRDTIEMVEEGVTMSGGYRGDGLAVSGAIEFVRNI